MAHHELVGLAGVALVLWAFAGLQLGRLEARRPAYSVLNGLGSMGLLYSLWFDFNLAAVLVNALWVLFSAWGLWRALRPPAAA